MAKKAQKKPKARQSGQSTKPLRAATAAVVSEKKTAPARAKAKAKATPAITAPAPLSASSTPCLPAVVLVHKAPPISDASDDANALFILGVRYSTGRDVEQDMITAHKWLNLAAMMGHEEAKAWRGDISGEMSKAQIAEAQKQARAWLQARETKRPRETAPVATPVVAVARPIYVRRHAQAMRSAQSFARVCACA